MLKSCKGSACLAYEEKLINEMDPHQDTSRSGKFNRAIEKAKSLTGEDWKMLAKQLKKFKNEFPSDITAPTAIQVKVAEDSEKDLLEIEEKLKKALDLTYLQTRYEVEILLLNYFNFLKENLMHVGDSEKQNEEDLTAPDMMKTLMKMLILNREKDKAAIEKIKSVLLEWEE